MDANGQPKSASINALKLKYLEKTDLSKSNSPFLSNSGISSSKSREICVVIAGTKIIAKIILEYIEEHPEKLMN